MSTSKLLTIFEGCDGSGKSTAAREYAGDNDAKYVHFHNLPRVKHGLARMYVEAMLPALLGYENVVFDRSWLSELPYGQAFREGQDRLTVADRCMLERLAMRCGAVVVSCRPPWEVVLDNYRGRKAKEMLKNEAQLREVYDIYKTQITQLPSLTYDFNEDLYSTLVRDIHHLRMPCHPLELKSAGNWQAETVLVGESFAERKDQDPWYQWPFASFSGEGCSQWLTELLASNMVNEAELLWVNADQDLEVLLERDLVNIKIFALGAKAGAELYRLKIMAREVPHPQYHKRFGGNQRYSLLGELT